MFADVDIARLIFPLLSLFAETPVKRFPLREQNLPVQILLGEWPADVTSVEKTNLTFYNFNDTGEVVIAFTSE